MKCELQKSKKSGKFIKFETNNDASWIKEDEEEDDKEEQWEEEEEKGEGSGIKKMVMDRQTNRRIDRRTDQAYQGDAWMHLKNYFVAN